MINLNYLKYFSDAANTGSVSQSAKLNYVSASAVSQGIKWLENWYQFDLIQHGKNRFELTDKGEAVLEASEKLFENVEVFNERLTEIAKPGTGVFKFSMQQSIANSIVAKGIKSFSDKYPDIDMKVRIGTSARCKELMDNKAIKYSISIDNVDFNAKNIELHQGSFVFISSKSDKRKAAEAGFITTEDTKELIDLKSKYYKKFKKEIPINYSISSWGVITNMALNGNGIAYIPDYYLKKLDKKQYSIRKIDVEKAQYCINFYYANDAELTPEILDFVKDIKRLFK